MIQRMNLRRIAIAALAIVALISMGTAARSSWNLLQGGGAADGISDYEIRFRDAKQSVPPDAVLGYITDLPYPAALFDAQTAQQYHWCRYAMAPVVIVREPARELLIGDFSDPIAVERAKANPHLRVEHDFGKGVVLFRRAGAP